MTSKEAVTAMPMRPAVPIAKADNLCGLKHKLTNSLGSRSPPPGILRLG